MESRGNRVGRRRRDERTSKDNNGPSFWGADSVYNDLVVEVVVGEGYVDAGF